MHKSDELNLRVYRRYKDEADDAKHNRMQLNRQNFNCYHLRQDWSKKIDGQSTEFLPKMAMATEQAANFLEQGLVDVGTWFRIEPAFGANEDAMAIKPHEMQKILAKTFDDISYVNTVGDASKLGLLGSLMIMKVRGNLIPKPKFVFTEALAENGFKPKLERVDNKTWQLKFDLVRQEDYYPDPTGRGLYEIEDTWMDFHEVLAKAKGPDKIYDLAAVKLLERGTTDVDDQKDRKSRETDQNTTASTGRKQIKVSELWGSIVDPTTGELLHENIVMTIANERTVIQAPTPNPFWHNKSPYIVSPIISVPHSVWGKALMDAPCALNRAINELANLILDGGLMSVHGIKQIRPNWLEDESQVSNGIQAGSTLKVNASTPVNGKVLERVDTATVPQDGLNVLNLFNQEHNAAAITNDFRSGVQSFRAVKATEVVEAGNAITSMFTGLVKKIETKFIDPSLEMAWMTFAQHIKLVDESWLASCVGEQRAKQIKALPAQRIFADTVNGAKFQAFGISQILRRREDLQALQLLLQIVSSSEALTESYINSGKSFDKLLGEILKSMGIQDDRLEETQPQGGAPQPQPQQGQPGQQVPDQQSQVPTPGAANSAPNQSGLPSDQFATNPNQ